MAQRIQSFRDIAAQYDVVLCDVWGVLHNGVEAFSHASEALFNLYQDMGAQLVHGAEDDGIRPEDLNASNDD